MTADPFPNAGPELRKASPAGARPTARQLLKELSGPVDEHFKRSLAGLSRKLGERVVGQATEDPKAAAEARRAALEAYDLARARRLKMVLGTTGAALATIGIASLTVFFAISPDPPPPRAMANTKRASPVEIAAVAPTPVAPLPVATAPSPSAPPAIVPVVAEVTPATASEPPPAPVPLRRDEVREVQTKLRSFGFDPGPLDGAAGPMTQAAVARYQQERGQQQTGAADRDLLEQLRQDPAPQVVVPVAQRAVRPSPSRATNSSGARSSDPFEPLRTALNRFEQWVQGR